MPFLRNITSGLRSLFRKQQVDRELDEELRATWHCVEFVCIGCGR